MPLQDNDISNLLQARTHIESESDHIAYENNTEAIPFKLARLFATLGYRENTWATNIPYGYMAAAIVLLFIALCELLISRIPLNIPIPSYSPPEAEAEATDTLAGMEENISRSTTSVWDDVPSRRVEELMAGAPPSRIAVVAGSSELTYAELEQKSSNLAVQIWQSLRSSRKSCICGLAVDKSIEMLLGILGILKAGGGYLALHPQFPDHRLQFLVQDSGAALVVTGADFLSKVQSFAQLPIIVIEAASIKKPSSSELASFLKSRSTLTSADTFGIIYTSGSTGQPKGVELTHQAVSTGILQELSPDVLKTGCRVLQNFSILFDPHITEIFGTFAAHQTLVLGPKDPTDMRALHQIMQSANVDCCFFVPSIFNVYAATYGIPSLKLLGFGGEVLPTKLWVSLATDSNTPRIENHYGPTESSICTSIFGPKPQLDVVSKIGSVPIGRALRWRECLIADPDTGDIFDSCGQIGELLIGGPGLAKGYINRPDTTAEKFIRHPRRPRERIYKSGDLVQLLDTGDLLFHGRADTQVKLHGLRIELGEIETVLRTCNDVVEAQVVKHDNDTLVAFLLPETVDVAAAAAACKARLAPYMVPSTIVVLAEFPRVPSGSKIDRKALMSWNLQDVYNLQEQEQSTDSIVEISQDSMLRMRLVSSEDLYVKSLLGFACVLFCTSHWRIASTRRLTSAHMEECGMAMEIGFLQEFDTPIFMACIAYTEATSLGVDGKSTAFVFTTREICIVLLWCGLCFPLPEVIRTLIYIFTGQNHYDKRWDFGGLEGPLANAGFWWFLPFLLFAKVYCVVSHRLRLPAICQLLFLLPVDTIVQMYNINWPPPIKWFPGCYSFQYSNVCIVGQHLAAYITLLIPYVIVLNYGQPFLHWCHHLRNVTITPSLRPLATLCLGLLMMTTQYFVCHAEYEQHLTLLFRVEPLFVLFASLSAVLFVPKALILQFIGRNAVFVFILHSFFGETWLGGLNIYGLQLLPKFETVVSAVLKHLQSPTIKLQGWIAMLICMVYAFLFVATIPFLFQKFVSLVAGGLSRMWCFALRNLGFMSAPAAYKD